MFDVGTTKLVVKYIEEHLAERLDLRAIAGAVCVSPYHLHRTFSRTVGLTIHDYLRRRQLTEAAKRLVFSGRSILDIALAAGYESQQAFTRIFTAMYKCPPNAFRKNRRFYPLQLQYEFKGESELLVEFGYPTQRFLFIRNSQQADTRNDRSPDSRPK